jgi:membrane protease YdiL (CAAX protease family)
VRSILKHFGVFLIWYVVSSAVVALAMMRDPPLIPPVAAPVLILLLFFALLRGYLLPPGSGSAAVRRRAMLRIRPLRADTLRWTLIATPVLLALSWTLQQVYFRLIPVPPESLNPFQHVTASPMGRLTIAVLAVGVAPVLEEFFFRGLIQRSLERRWGPAAGIAGAAALFAAMHVLPWIFPLHFFLGLAFGFAVYASRSIWTGVVLHAANNSVALIGILLDDAPPSPTPTLWERGVDLEWWSAVLLLLLALAAAAWTGRRLWEAGRRLPLAAAAALTLLLAGCDADLGLGIGTQCAAEKREVRQRLGTPDRVEQGIRGELWVYNAENLAYEFSWDQNGENCTVQVRSAARLPRMP